MRRHGTDDQVERPAFLAQARRLAPQVEKVGAESVSALHELRELVDCAGRGCGEGKRLGNDGLRVQAMVGFVGMASESK